MYTREKWALPLPPHQPSGYGRSARASVPPSSQVRAVIDAGRRELWHVSEDPTIEVFVPHHQPLHALDEPLVWAVDTWHMPLYWFPRDCPRACWWAKDDTTDEDVERWLDGDRTRRVSAVESAWLERLRAVRLYAYRLPDGSFEPWDSSSSRATPLRRSSWSSSATSSRAMPTQASSCASRRRSIPSGTR